MIITIIKGKLPFGMTSARGKQIILRFLHFNVHKIQNIMFG